MATDAADEAFVTIVPVGEGRSAVRDPSTFVTVLTVGSTAGAYEVVVRRPKGARLGLGLKFEGGSAAAEKVRKLLVQSCAEDSPAANAITPWGKLIPGDEILAIDNVPVADLTRIDCVRRLKDSDETLKLLVRHLEINNDIENNKIDAVDSLVTAKQATNISRPMLPPPVPPRKLGKKNSFKDKLLMINDHNGSGSDGKKKSSNDNEFLGNGKHGISSQINKLSRKSSFDSHLHRQNKEGMTCFRKGSPEEVRRLARRLSDGKVIPPDAEVYIDLLSTEWERCLALADAESDDTGSSISTVVDRLGSMTSSVDNSIPNTPIMQPKTIDIHKVLNSIENIDTNILRDITCNKFLDSTIDNNSENKILESCTEALDKHDIIANKNNVAANSEQSMIPNKKEMEHDKNNNSTNRKNNTKKRDTKEVSQATDKIIDSEINAEKPKPMPRNTKLERSLTEKSRIISIPKTSSANSSDTLLTPTKKNCIETWLQRSEAEMNCKNMEKLEESSVPEALPRLIDFVPKSQFKECESETPTLKRPTTAPPPPPTETREDGSGASLDTIGEVDESSDVTDNTKPTITKNDSNKRKPSIERSFWEDRINKSDVEDKSLSNDESPLPTCPRQPPDGVETPSEAVEKAPELPKRLPPKLPERWTSTRKRYSYSSRTQDARSEASVKDKIAMFSNDHNTISSDRSEKFGTLPVRNSISKRKEISSFTDNYSSGISLDRRLTKSQDNLDEMPYIYRRHSERPEVMGELEIMTKTGNCEVISSNVSRSQCVLDRKPLFYASSNTLSSNTDSLLKHTVFHARSISDDNGNKVAHKSNLDYLIEQRKKSMSKLRGLVIPESQAPISDLPEIKVQVPLSKSIVQKTNQSSLTPQNVSHKVKPALMNESKWKANILPNNIPKYSPAFKRKSLQVYTPSSLSKESNTPMRTFSEKIEALNKINENNSIISRLTRSSLDLNCIERRVTAQPVLLDRFSNETKYKEPQNDVRSINNVEIKICTTTDVVDSDNDSAMSSTQSSYRSSASSPIHNLESIESDNSRISPRIQHYTTFALVKSDIPTKSLATEKRCEEYVKRSVCRSMSSDTNISISSSAGSAATSGSQASCSSLESSVADTDKRKISKVYNIDTINRKNILASAKCRSGRDEKVKSPVIENKFTHEPSSVSLSPEPKTAERLSTLTTSASAISNKGENRRRNKVVSETDSDSDSEIKMRQRKTDYKNTRLKRNPSSSNKNKPNENVETTKVENTALILTDKNIKETKNIVLDNLDCTDLLKGDNAKNDNNDCIKIKKEENSFIKDKSRCSNLNNDNNNVLTTTSPLTNDDADNTAEKKDIIFNEEYKIPTQIIRLKRGAGTGVGLILAGGVDCEAKDVTIHRVLADSIANRAGLKRGMKVRSINNCAMVGLTHAQSVAVLKEQRAEVVIEIENEMLNTNGIGCGSKKVETKVGQDFDKEITTDKVAGSVVTVTLEKAGGGTGLGFGLDGGRDSPYGDRPLTIKKLFAGGSAAQTGKIVVGAELLSAGGQSMEGFTRTQAWAALKALPTGLVTLVLKNP